MVKWLKVSPMLMAHPAVGLVGNRGLGAWMRCAMWLSVYPQDGDVVPAPVVRFVAGKRDLQALLDAGLLVEHDEGYVVTNTLNICGSNRSELAWQPGPDGREPRPAIPRDLRKRVYERDGHQCVTCGSVERLSLDHIYPYSLGGPDTFENLQTLCRPCNSRKGARV